MLPVLAVALIARLLLVAPALDSPYFSDETAYAELALSLAEGRGYRWANGEPAVRFAPLWPAALAVAQTVGGPAPAASRLLQVLLGCALVALIMLLAAELANEPRVPTIAGWWAALSPTTLYFSTSLFSETLFGLCLGTALLALLRLVRDGRARWPILAGLACGLGCLCRGSVLFFLPLVAGWIVRVAPAARRRRDALLVLGLSAVVVAPWTVRNHRAFGAIIPVDNNGAWNLYMGNTMLTPTLSAWKIVGMPERGELAIGIADPVAQQAEAMRRVKTYLADHPGRFALMTLTRAANLWGLARDLPSGFNSGLYGIEITPVTMLVTAVSALEGLALLILMIWGLTLTPHREAAWLQGLLITYLTLIHGISYGHSRYRFGALLLGYALAATVIPPRRELLRGHRWAVLAGWVLAGVLVWDVLVLELWPMVAGRL